MWLANVVYRVYASVVNKRGRRRSGGREKSHGRVESGFERRCARGERGKESDKVYLDEMKFCSPSSVERDESYTVVGAFARDRRPFDETFVV